VSAVVAGRSYTGRAFVVNGWYLCGYSPIYDAGRRVIGMLFAGMPEALMVEPVRRSIMNIRIGKTGYVFVVNATGSTRGYYVVSAGGKRDGENICDPRESSGAHFIQEICRKALALDPGETGVQRYPWKNTGESQAYMKVAYLKYFKPWDWVIGTSVPEREYLEGAVRIESVAGRGILVLLIVTLVASGLAAMAWYGISRALMKKVGPAVQEVQQLAASSVQLSSSSQQLAQGAAGMGFAVVAHEVRTLAQRSAAAGRETAE
jgi:signal transduction histidine kinase